MHDGTEDHRRNHHLDQCDEAVAEPLQRLAEIRKEISDQYTERDRDENLNIQDLVPPLMTGGRMDRFSGHAASGVGRRSLAPPSWARAAQRTNEILWNLQPLRSGPVWLRLLEVE